MYQPLYDRHDLAAPTLDGPDFIRLLHSQRKEKYPEPPERKDCMPRAYDALKRHDGIAEEHLQFFPNYIEDVEKSIPWEEDVLDYWACSPQRQLTAARAFRNRLDIEYQLLLPIHHTATGERVPFQVA